MSPPPDTPQGSPEPAVDPPAAGNGEGGENGGRKQFRLVELFSDDEPIVDRGTNLLQVSGALVFIAAAVLGLIFLTVSALPFMGIESWVRLRSIELFAMIGAIGIVVAIMARARKAFVSTFGILLIGALIVPAKDMAALAFWATGRSMSNETRKNSAQDGSEFRSRDSDLANKILSRLQETPKVAGQRVESPQEAILGNLSAGERHLAEVAISESISADRKITHLERLRYNGSLSMLLAFAPGRGEDYEQYYYRYKGGGGLPSGSAVPPQPGTDQV